MPFPKKFRAFKNTAKKMNIHKKQRTVNTHQGLHMSIDTM